MSLYTAAEQRRRTALRRVLLAAVALLLVVAASVAVTLWVIGGDRPDTATPPPADPPAATPTTSGSSDPTPEDPEAGTWQQRPVSAGPLILPSPQGQEEGIPTGFPHTTEGAISAAAHYAQAGTGLDPEVARSLGEVAAAPSYVDAPEDFVPAASSARRSLGLPADGGLDGAYLMFTAQAYRVSDATPDRVALAVLGQVDGAGPATQGQGRTSHAATSYTMVWVDGDWRIAGDGEPLPDTLPAPRSPAAYEEGWRDLALA